MNQKIDFEAVVVNNSPYQLKVDYAQLDAGNWTKRPVDLTPGSSDTAFAAQYTQQDINDHTKPSGQVNYKVMESANSREYQVSLVSLTFAGSTKDKCNFNVISGLHLDLRTQDGGPDIVKFLIVGGP